MLRAAVRLFLGASRLALYLTRPRRFFLLLRRDLAPTMFRVVLIELVYGHAHETLNKFSAWAFVKVEESLRRGF